MTIRSRPSTDTYRAGWDRIFGEPRLEELKARVAHHEFQVKRADLLLRYFESHPEAD